MNSQRRWKLLDNDQLKESSTVANCLMNRERQAFGDNSYEKEIFLNPVSFLMDRVKRSGGTRWLDICCGSGRALIQAMRELRKENLDRYVLALGIDLAGIFDPIPDGTSNLRFRAVSLEEYETTRSFDLITCVHGLHYLGDKLAVISKFIALLKADGLFIGNIDTNNIFDPSGKKLGRTVNTILRKQDLIYDARNKILKCNGGKELTIPMKYLGADDRFGKNYTGQEVVSSYYIKNVGSNY